MITEQERSELKALIEAQIAEIAEAIPQLRKRSAPVEPDNAIGRLSRTDSMMDAGTAGLVLKEKQNRLLRLRNRLQRIADPNFDRCAVCGGDIPIGRLRAVPDTAVCANC